MILTIEGWNVVKHFTGIELRVLLDGEEVTGHCIEADAECGWVYVFQLDANGKHFKSPHGNFPAKEVRYGKVTIVRKAESA